MVLSRTARPTRTPRLRGKLPCPSGNVPARLTAKACSINRRQDTWLPECKAPVSHSALRDWANQISLGSLSWIQGKQRVRCLPVIRSKEEPSRAVGSRSSTPAFLIARLAKLVAMTTRAPINRLTQRIEALAARKVALRPRKVVQIKVNGESNDAARQRHDRLHPEDRGSRAPRG